MANIITKVSIIYFILIRYLSPFASFSEDIVFFSTGNVEIFHNGVWGNICDDEWDIKDATVVCKQLGFRGVEKITHSSHFGPAVGKN